MTTRVGDHVQIRNTQARVTPRPASDRFRDALGRGATELLTGVEQLAGLAPGGSAITAAVRGAAGNGNAPGGGGQTAEGPGGATPESPMSSALMDSSSQSMQLLELQQQISMEQRQFTTVSNVMKARHDTAKSVINNVR